MLEQVPQDLPMPLVALSCYGLNWEPLGYTHPGWYDRLALKAAQVQRVSMYSRRWKLLNLQVIERMGISSLRLADVRELPAWWHGPSTLLAGFATRLTVLALAGRMSVSVGGPELQQLEQQAGAALMKAARASLSDGLAWRSVQHRINWRAFEAEPHPSSLGLQMLLSQIEDEQSGARRRMALRSRPALVTSAAWRGESTVSLDALIAHTWMRYPGRNSAASAA